MSFMREKEKSMKSNYQIIYTDQYDIDYDEIADYFIEKFKNPDLIVNLNNQVLKRENLLRQFPYSFPRFESNSYLKHDYRTFNVLNYKVFYYIDELAKVVYLERILYSRMDFKIIGL